MKRIYRFLPFIFLVIIIFLSLGKTFQYFFYTDDYALLYHIQQHYSYGFPYDWVTRTLWLPYQIFGVNPKGYFVLGVGTYFLAAVALFFFVKKLTKNFFISAAAMLLFATGYMGIDEFTQLVVSITSNLNIIAVCLVMICYLQWLEQKKARFYFATLLLFTLSVEIFPYRAFPLLVFIPTLGVIFSLKCFSTAKKFCKNFLNTLLLLIPFLIVPRLLQVKHEGIYSFGGTSFNDFFRTFFHNTSFQGIINSQFVQQLFGIPGKCLLIKPIAEYLGISPNQQLYFLVGLGFILTVTFVGFIFSFGKYSKYARSLLILTFLTLEAYVGNLILAPNFDANGFANRYLTLPFAFFAATLPVFLFLIIDTLSCGPLLGKKTSFFRQEKAATVIGLVIFTCLALFLTIPLSREYEESIIENRSDPARTFFTQLRKFVPQLAPDHYSVFYFDSASYGLIPSQFGLVLSGAVMGKDVDLAMPYRVPIESIKIADSFTDFLQLFKNPPTQKKVDYYTFYDDERGMHNTTAQVLSLLKNGTHTTVPAEQIGYKMSTESAVVTVTTSNVSSLTPVTMKMDTQVTPRDYSSFRLPLFGVSTNKSEIFSYLSARKQYYQTVRVETDSEHVSKQFPASLLVDGRVGTYWLANEYLKTHWIKLDLGQTKKISRIFWRQMTNRVPSQYVIETSMDGKSWFSVGNLHRNELGFDPTLVVHDFSPVTARYVEILIQSTNDNLAPALDEVEVIESAYEHVDLQAAQELLTNPFGHLSSQQELAMTYAYLKNNASVKISTLTDKDGDVLNTNYDDLPITIDGITHEYALSIPASGTSLKLIVLQFNYPVNVVVNKVVIENQPLK